MTTINHPYIKTLEAELEKHYELHERLIKRNELVRENYSTKTEYEKNEIEINVIKTKTEINGLKKVINFREDYYKKFIEQFAKDLEECEANFEESLNTARERQEKIIGMKDMLEAVKWDAVESDAEVKVKLYQRIKKMIQK